MGHTKQLLCFGLFKVLTPNLSLTFFFLFHMLYDASKDQGLILIVIYNCILVYSYSDLITTFDIQREENLDTKILSALLKGNLDTVHQLYLGRIIIGLNKKEKPESSYIIDCILYIIFLLINTVKSTLNL